MTNQDGLLHSGAGERVLVVKQLTFSDSSFEVSKTGRVVLPRAQVQECLTDILKRGGAGHAVASLKSSAAPRLAVDLVVYDQFGQSWVIAMKTWQNVVSGQHRPTFVLENTAEFMRAHNMQQGAVLAITTDGSRLILRTDLGLDARTGCAPPVPARASLAAAAPLRQAPAPKRKAIAVSPRRPTGTKRRYTTQQEAQDPTPSFADVNAANVLLALSSDTSSHDSWSSGDSSINAAAAAVAEEETSIPRMGSWPAVSYPGHPSAAGFQPVAPSMKYATPAQPQPQQQQQLEQQQLQYHQQQEMAMHRMPSAPPPALNACMSSLGYPSNPTFQHSRTVQTGMGGWMPPQASVNANVHANAAQHRPLSGFGGTTYANYRDEVALLQKAILSALAPAPMMSEGASGNIGSIFGRQITAEALRRML